MESSGNVTESIRNEVESIVNEAVNRIYRQGQKVKDAFNSTGQWIRLKTSTERDTMPWQYSTLCTRNLLLVGRSFLLCGYRAATLWTGKEWDYRGNALPPSSY